jgi:hypothetical protein
MAIVEAELEAILGLQGYEALITAEQRDAPAVMGAGAECPSCMASGPSGTTDGHARAAAPSNADAHEATTHPSDLEEGRVREATANCDPGIAHRSKHADDNDQQALSELKTLAGHREEHGLAAVLDARSAALVSHDLAEHPAVADGERQFAAVMAEFHRSATGQQAALEIASQCTQCQVSDLAAWLGEPLGSDPATILMTLWSFVIAFDQSYRAFC